MRSDAAFYVDTAGSWDGTFIPHASDLAVAIDSPTGECVVVVLSARYTEPSYADACDAVQAWIERDSFARETMFAPVGCGFYAPAVWAQVSDVNGDHAVTVRFVWDNEDEVWSVDPDSLSDSDPFVRDLFGVWDVA